MPHAYVVITPARNEAERIVHTIESMVAQTHRPLRWVIINDGSTDDTALHLDRAAQAHPWILPVHRPDRGFRKQGGGVIEAFYDGYPLVESIPWEFIVKFDADLAFDPDYFERCLAHFDLDPSLGIAGGAVWTRLGDHFFNDGASDPPFHVRGATKIYRRACWLAIGGLIQLTGWDTFDEVKANSIGWSTRTLPEIRVTQLRQTGGVDGSWRNWFKNGRANYIIGYHPAFMLAKCVRRLFQKPYFLAALALATGFFSGYLQQVRRVPDPEAIRFLRRQQFRALLGQPSFWTR